MALERELKYILTKQHYTRLNRSLKDRPYSIERQRNYYFDDNKLSLRRKKIGLRVRLLEKGAILSLKYATGKRQSELPASYKIRHEFETRLSKQQAHSLIRGSTKFGDMNNFPARRLKGKVGPALVDDIVSLGKLDTKRTKFRLPDRLVLELDHFKIFGSDFYELEVETNQPEKIDKTVRQLFRSNGIPYRPIRKSKLARFLAAWKQAYRKKKRSSRR